jgi:wyosine [tRNA(Phe)-imidazoG37] synthetase (radical SAM superfamily)
VEKNKIIFGPINSRRFGMSLGIDLSPSHKQCNFDCLYCELAPAQPVEEQTDIIAVDTIISALKGHLTKDIDVITLTANGEPTLYPYLNKLIDELDTLKGDIQTLILTNSATLMKKEVFDSLLKLDQVKLSLDAVTPQVFKKIDRPHADISIDKIVTTLKKFAQQYQGKLFIEILFVRGLNDSSQEIKALNTVLKDIKVTRIDLGTIDRPPAYPVEGLSYQELHTIAQSFDKQLPIHIASRQHAEMNHRRYTKEEILNTLDKRPLTQEDIDLLFDKKSKILLKSMIKKKEITQKEVGSLLFFLPQKNNERKRVKK